MPQAPSSRVQAAGVTITIDGIGTDWTSAVATFTDSPTDAGGGSGDITKVWVTADGTNVYVRWDETLTSNKNKIASDGFSVGIDTSGGGTINARLWALFDAQGNATTKVEKPLGSFTTTGSAMQNCSPGPATCANGAAAFVEGAWSLTSLGVTSGNVVGMQAETRASNSTSSSVKDCVPRRLYL